METAKTRPSEVPSEPVDEPEPELELELEEPDPPLRLQLSVHSEFHVPLVVRLFRPVKLRACVSPLYDQPLLTACPFSVTLDTCPGTPKTVTLPSEMVST